MKLSRLRIVLELQPTAAPGGIDVSQPTS